MNEATARVHHTTGALNFCLEMFGNELAKREGYREYKAMDAIYFYLMMKHGWLPRDVRSMSFEDLRFALGEEMHGWALPKHLRNVYPE
ncbi:hypothetical protein HY78_15650 [Rhizorhabdus wittichii DC-6]|nr:hypothetical protein HY78_15650 [Rhizorhabdus wittichii DC-6]